MLTIQNHEKFDNLQVSKDGRWVQICGYRTAPAPVGKGWVELWRVVDGCGYENPYPPWVAGR